MPKPPLLPTIDWKQVFERAKPYENWLGTGENPNNAHLIDSARFNEKLPDYATPFLAALPRAVHIIAIAEDWCGDVVRHVPCLMKIADNCDKIQVRFLYRSDRPDIFARYLTNGGEAIPKLIFLSEQFVECGNWGPMPEACRELIARGKACQDVGAARRLVARAYEADPLKKTVYDELLRLIDIAASVSPNPDESLLKQYTRSQENAEYQGYAREGHWVE